MDTVKITTGGSGYTTAPTVAFTSTDGNGTGATGFATIQNGQVVSVTITNSGSGYDAAPTVTFTGGGGTGATATTTFVAFQTAKLNVTGATISDNVALANSDGLGGGIGNAGNGAVTITDSTIADNDANNVGGGFSDQNAADTLTVVNSTFTANFAEDGGGGIFVQGSSVTITGSTFQYNSNEDDNGGGLSAGMGTTAVLQNDLFLNNLSFGNGGGVSASGPSVTISQSTFRANVCDSDDGGGLFTDTGTTSTLQNDLFVNNSADAEGGGIAATGATISIANTELKDNSADGDGGGLFDSGTTVTLLDTTIADNTCSVFGGGVEFDATGTGNQQSVFTNVTITGNSAVSSNGGTNGGGIDINGSGSLEILNSTINSNFADNGGGVFWTGSGGGVTFQSTIVAGNVADTAGPDLDTSGKAITDGGFNLIGSSSTTFGFTAATDQLGTAANPLNPLLGPLQNNGGPTIGVSGDALTLETEALLPGSPAIDKGFASGTLTTDERGFLRLVGGAVDVGAFEFQPGATMTTLITSASSILQGQPVTLTAHVVPDSMPPNNPVTGTVTFTDGSLTLGMGTLDATGTATITVTNLPAGQSTVLATYNPDTQATELGFLTSTSTGQPETVTPTNVAPVVTLTASITTVTTTTIGGTTFSQTVTLTVQVTPPANDPFTPSGTVTIFDGNIALNATPLTLNANGAATLQLTGLPMGTPLVGGESLKAVYTPDATGAANGFITASSQPIVLTVGTPAELVLNQLFEDLLRRPVNAGDLQFWVPQLGDLSNPASQTAQSNVEKVTLGILQSPAYQTQEITDLFLNYLGRMPNQNDLNFWLPQFQNGITLEQAATMIVTSPEFISKNGGTSDGTVNGIPSQQLITALFQDALGRAPLPQDFTAVQGQTLQQLVNNIFSSPEYEGHLVDVFYQDYLRRTAQGTEADFWMNFYPGGSSFSQVPKGVQPDVFIISGFIGSQEYIQDVLNNPLGLTPVPTNPLQASIS